MDATIGQGWRETINDYDRLADAYHGDQRQERADCWKTQLEVPAMERCLKPLVRGKSVLDLGCGTGLLSSRALDWGAASVSGVDPSSGMLEVARRQLPLQRFCLGRGEDLPFESDAFQVVMSSMALHYVELLEPVFKECARVLLPQGQLVFSMHHPAARQFRGENAPYFGGGAYRWAMFGREFQGVHHTISEVVEGLSRCGFVLEEWIDCQPGEEVRETFPDFDHASRFPTFCVVRARLSH